MRASVFRSEHREPSTDCRRRRQILNRGAGSGLPGAASSGAGMRARQRAGYLLCGGFGRGRERLIDRGGTGGGSRHCPFSNQAAGGMRRGGAVKSVHHSNVDRGGCVGAVNRMRCGWHSTMRFRIAACEEVSGIITVGNRENQSESASGCFH